MLVLLATGVVQYAGECFLRETGLKKNDYTVAPVLNHKRFPVFAVCVFNKKNAEFVDEKRTSAKETLSDRIGTFIGKGNTSLVSLFGRKNEIPDEPK